jgi:hypothetical protein
MIGSIVLLKNMSLDYKTVINACWYGILGAIIAGFFGFYIGKVLETASISAKKNNYNHSKKSGKKAPDNNEIENNLD